jgi:hypothetical protein
VIKPYLKIRAQLENPKSEARNPKQARISKNRNSKEESVGAQIRICFGHLDFGF